MNAKDFPRGRIFTLIHEVAHIAVNLGGLCDLHDNHGDSGELESIFNNVAGELLVPSDALLSEQTVLSNKSFEWPDSLLKDLANQFMVSREVILRRLLELGRTTQAFYRKKRKQFIKEYAAHRAPGFRYTKKIS